MKGEMFETSVDTQLVPTLRTVGVFILCNLSSHRSPSMAKAIRDIGVCFLFLPPNSPDLNPIDMVLLKR